jgi:YfiH family protein
MERFTRIVKENKPDVFVIESWMNRYPNVFAGFSSRLGGSSEERFDSLNCALHVGDEPQRVIENRRRLADMLGVPVDAWTCAEQVHGNEVVVVTENDRGKGLYSRESAFQGKDAMICNIPGVWLTSFYADCVPLYFFDPVREAVGLAHAGWKGTVAEIAEKTVLAMMHEYSSEPADILAAIGPAIGMCCYEVDRKVIDKVRSLTITPAEGETQLYHELGEGKYMLDLKEINRQIMIKAGILATNIEISQWCTGCRNDLFFSHRKENGKTGRMVSWIGLRKKEVKR